MHRVAPGFDQFFGSSALDVKISSLFFLKVSLRLQGLTLTTVGLVITYRVF